jgi:hypothetical protein
LRFLTIPDADESLLKAILILLHYLDYRQIVMQTRYFTDKLFCGQIGMEDYGRVFLMKPKEVTKRKKHA